MLLVLVVLLHCCLLLNAAYATHISFRKILLYAPNCMRQLVCRQGTQLQDTPDAIEPSQNKLHLRICCRLHQLEVQSGQKLRALEGVQADLGHIADWMQRTDGASEQVADVLEAIQSEQNDHRWVATRDTFGIRLSGRLSCCNLFCCNGLDCQAMCFNDEALFCRLLSFSAGSLLSSVSERCMLDVLHQLCTGVRQADG